jgi:zinc finger HIT domain-containing protein 1
MFVEEIAKPTASTGKKRTSTGVSSRFSLDSAAQQNRIARHLNELEQDNYHTVQIEIPKSDRTLVISHELMTDSHKPHKLTMNVRKLLTTRKTLTNLLDEAKVAADIYRNAAVEQGPYPTRTFCSVCGYWGKYMCMQCGERYCGQGCLVTHQGRFLI